MVIRAVIDVGSHSVLLLAAVETPRGPRVLLEDYSICALGSGLGQTGRIDPRAAARTGRVIAEYLERCHELGAGRILVVGTSALREAENQEEILGKLSGSSGQEIQVLSRDEEARLTRRGALSGLDAGDDALVVDLGGRSTEITGPDVSTSLPIGCQRGSEDHLTEDPPTAAGISDLRARVRSHLPPPPEAGALVFSGGTATTLAAMDLALSTYHPEAIHGQRMSPARLGELIDRLVAVPLAERKQLAGIEPGRADVLPAGAVILDELCCWIRRESFLVSARGLTWGIWLSGS